VILGHGSLGAIQHVEDQATEERIAHLPGALDLPLALGFGVKDRADVDFLRGRADLAVIGTQTIRLVEEQGVDAVKPFIASLRG